MVVDVALLLSFLVFSALLSAVPGPSIVLSTGRAVTTGRAPAMRIVLGNFLGGLVLVTCAVAGLGAVLAASATLFTVVKWLGACYLLLLGVRALLAARRSARPAPEGPSGTGARRTHPLREGLLVGVSNPKSLVTLAAVLPQFVDPAVGSVQVQLAVIGLAGALTQLLVESTWVWAATGLRSWFQRRPRRLVALQACGGLAMIGLAGRVALQRPAT